MHPVSNCLCRYRVRSHKSLASTARARSYALSEAAARRMGHRPCLLLLKGHPGSGKSTLAKELAAQLAWPLIDKDDARDTLHVQTALAGTGVDLNALSYDIMWAYARTQLRVGLSCVVDCPLARFPLFLRGRDLAAKYGATVAVVECQARDVAVWKQWLGERTAGGPVEAGHKPQTWEQLQALIEGYQGADRWTDDMKRSVPLYLCVDTTRDGPDTSFKALAAEVAAEERAELHDLGLQRVEVDKDELPCAVEPWDHQHPHALPLGALDHRRLEAGLVSGEVDVRGLIEHKGIPVQEGEAREGVGGRGREVAPEERGGHEGQARVDLRVPPEVVDVLPAGAQHPHPAQRELVGVGGPRDSGRGEPGQPRQQAPVHRLLGQARRAGVPAPRHDIHRDGGRQLGQDAVRHHHRAVVHLDGWPRVVPTLGTVPLAFLFRTVVPVHVDVHGTGPISGPVISPVRTTPRLRVHLILEPLQEGAAVVHGRQRLGVRRPAPHAFASLRQLGRPHHRAPDDHHPAHA